MSLTVRFPTIPEELYKPNAAQLELMRGIPTPPFESHLEDLGELVRVLEPFQHFKNLLVIGNGGSIWSFLAYNTALGDRLGGKKVAVLSDMEPDYLSLIKKQFPVGETLVIVISKSGSTVGVIENIFAFWEYDQLFVTDPEGPIGKIGKSREATVIAHPNVGGRYTGFGSTAYVPAILMGLPVEDIERGGRSGYERFRKFEKGNVAIEVAVALANLETEGYTEIFLPIYSNFLQTFGMVVTQLFHESFGKDGKGLTVLTAQAPESQHHTNQRYFGGRKNSVGVFLHVENQSVSDMVVAVPSKLRDLPLRTGKMGDIDGINLADSFHTEYQGTIGDAVDKKMRVIDIVVDRVTGESVGELMAFWHYVTVFSAALREVDPFDQPQVEDSKVISFKERLRAMGK